MVDAAKPKSHFALGAKFPAPSLTPRISSPLASKTTILGGVVFTPKLFVKPQIISFLPSPSRSPTVRAAHEFCLSLGKEAAQTESQDVPFLSYLIICGISSPVIKSVIPSTE